MNAVIFTLALMMSATTADNYPHAANTTMLGPMSLEECQEKVEKDKMKVGYDIYTRVYEPSGYNLDNIVATCEEL